jgi:hypothetical protein
MIVQYVCQDITIACAIVQVVRGVVIEHAEGQTGTPVGLAGDGPASAPNSVNLFWKWYGSM